VVGFGDCSTLFFFLLFLSLMIDHFHIQHHSFILNDDHRRKRVRENRCSVRQNQERRNFIYMRDSRNDERVVCTIIIDKKKRRILLEYLQLIYYFVFILRKKNFFFFRFDNYHDKAVQHSVNWLSLFFLSIYQMTLYKNISQFNIYIREKKTLNLKKKIHPIIFLSVTYLMKVCIDIFSYFLSSVFTSQLSRPWHVFAYFMHTYHYT